LLRNAAHRFAGSGFRGAFRIQRNTVRSEMSNLWWVEGSEEVGG